MAKMTPTVLGLMGERQQQGEGKKFVHDSTSQGVKTSTS